MPTFIDEMHYFKDLSVDELLITLHTLNLKNN